MKERSQERGNNRLQLTETVFEKVLGPHKLKWNKILTISQDKCPFGLKDMDTVFFLSVIYFIFFSAYSNVYSVFSEPILSLSILILIGQE